VAGPLTAWIISALEGAIIFSGISAFSAALYSIGIPKDSLLEYEVALKAGKFVLILNGTSEEITQAQEVIKSNKPDFIHQHKFATTGEHTVELDAEVQVSRKNTANL
jgi:hypothetical protein